jgi:endonuclease YncB( thermonuclease family)
MIKTLGKGARPCRMIRFRDGDTAEILIELDFGVWLEMPVRLIGLESWELNSADRARAQLAAQNLTAAFSGRTMTLTPATLGLDKYGRIRARLTVEGRDLAMEIVKMGEGWYSKRKTNGADAPQARIQGDH